MSGPLLWKVSPIVGETLMSLVTRAAARNLLPSSHVLLGQVGAPHAQNPTVALSPAIDGDRLATILRVPVEEVAMRRHAASGRKGFVDHFGVVVRADEILFRHRRFAPTSVGRSAHARALWSLKTVPCCTESWEYLLDSCPCGAVQGWRYAERLDRCDICNIDLGALPGTPVPAEIREDLSFLVGLLDPHPVRRSEARRRLPPGLTEWDGGMVLELALALMPLTRGGHRPMRGMKPDFEQLPQYTASLAEAARLVLDWPSSFVPALEAAVHSHGRSRPNVRYPGIGHYVAGMDGGITPAPVTAAIENALKPISDGSNHAIDMRQAMRTTGHLEFDLATARRAGRLRTRVAVRGHRIMPMLDLGEIESVKDFLRSRLGPDRAATLLGLPAYAMRLLADEGLIVFETHPYLVDRYGEHQMHAAQLADLERELQRAAVPKKAIADGITLQRAARAIGGGPKPWGRMVRSLVDGIVPFSMDGRRINDIVVDRTYALDLRSIDLACPTGSIFDGTCSQRDATEVLNLPLKHAHLIADAAMGPLTGTWSIEWKKLLHKARTRVTLAELQARTGVHGTRLEAILERKGVLRADELGWRRSEVLPAVDLLHLP